MNEKMACLLMIHFQVTDKDFLAKLTEIEKTNRKNKSWNNNNNNNNNNNRNNNKNNNNNNKSDQVRRPELIVIDKEEQKG